MMVKNGKLVPATKNGKCVRTGYNVTTNGQGAR